MELRNKGGGVQHKTTHPTVFFVAVSQRPVSDFLLSDSKHHSIIHSIFSLGSIHVQQKTIVGGIIHNTDQIPPWIATEFVLRLNVYVEERNKSTQRERER